jgi:sugar O-acyltransferase (sialic acid O-acetyltransferase NeuD family)
VPETAPHPEPAVSTANHPGHGAASRVLVLGAGGHGRVVLDILQQCGRQVVGFLDNNREIFGRRIDGVPVLGGIADIGRIAREHEAAGAVVAIGDNGVRRGLAREVRRLGLELANAIHPSATISASATLGRNVVAAAGVVVCAHCQVGDSVILNTGCIVDHQTMIGEGTHICPGVRVAGRVKIEAGAFLGIGSTVIPKVIIGCESIVGAGAVVISDVEPMSTVVGVPARAVKRTQMDEDVAALILPARA